MPEASPPAPNSALAVFSLVAGPRAGEELPVLAPIIAIGQAPQNDLVIADDSVSKQHARLEYLLEGWRLTDLESTNGTTVEGIRLAPGVPTPLAYGSEVRFGGVRMMFTAAHDADPESARTSFTPAESLAPDRPRHFRLPLWVFVLILLVIALVLFLLFGLSDAGAALP
jgi:Inner membrane component of T3SS, cytoplasmic domain